MEVKATNASSTSASGSRNAGRTELDYDAFLQLLMTQMRNQDPTKPMDSTAFMAQLATFSQVQQSVKTNDKLDLLMERSDISSAGSLVGRTVTDADGNTGKVKAVSVYSDGVVATLEDGKKLLLGPGTQIA